MKWWLHEKKKKKNKHASQHIQVFILYISCIQGSDNSSRGFEFLIKPPDKDIGFLFIEALLHISWGEGMVSLETC